MTKRAKRSPYTRERRAEALALARIAGAEVASQRSRIPVQTIRRWMDATGVQPGSDLPQERLEALRDLAEATVTRDLVEGRIRGVQAMIVAGIARRHFAKVEATKADGSGSAVAAKGTFLDWLERVAADSIEDEQAIEATIAAVGAIVPDLLLPRANAEADRYAPPSPHRVAILAWFSGRPENPAGDVVEWAKAQVDEVIDTHGSLVGWDALPASRGRGRAGQARCRTRAHFSEGSGITRRGRAGHPRCRSQGASCRCRAIPPASNMKLGVTARRRSFGWDRRLRGRLPCPRGGAGRQAPTRRCPIRGSGITERPPRPPGEPRLGATDAERARSRCCTGRSSDRRRTSAADRRSDGPSR